MKKKIKYVLDNIQYGDRNEILRAAKCSETVYYKMLKKGSSGERLSTLELELLSCAIKHIDKKKKLEEKLLKSLDNG